jgi:hypothetical protein
MVRPRPSTAIALAAALALLMLVAPAALARSKSQHLLDSARTSARNANTALTTFQTSVGGDTAAAGTDKAALASQLDQLDYQLNVARKNSDRLSRRLAARAKVVLKRSKRRSSRKSAKADRTLAKRMRRASKASGAAGAALRSASDTTEQLAFDLRSTPPPDALPVSIPIGEIGTQVNNALALLQKILPAGLLR